MPASGWSSSAAPAPPPPITTWKTSPGTPASCISSPIASPVRDANSDGLYSTALPVSSAGTKTFDPTNQG